jgi:arginine decarboxylase
MNLYLPKYSKEKPLYIGFFSIQVHIRTIGGYGRIASLFDTTEAKHILID